MISYSLRQIVPKSCCPRIVYLLKYFPYLLQILAWSCSFTETSLLCPGPSGADYSYQTCSFRQTMRFKPPPANSEIGWRVEFRPCELQFTDFENAALVSFVVILTRAILSYGYNLLVRHDRHQFIDFQTNRLSLIESRWSENFRWVWLEVFQNSPTRDSV